MYSSWNCTPNIWPLSGTRDDYRGGSRGWRSGGAHIEWGWCGHAAHTVCRIFSLRTYNVQRSRRVWGHAPLGKFFKFRPYESTSETVRDQCKMFDNRTVTLVIHRMVYFSDPLSLRNQPLYVRHCHKTVSRSCRYECFMFAGHESRDSSRDVRCVGVAMCAKHVVNLRV